MIDRELLELAAKAASAAGMDIIESDAGPQIFERYSSDGFMCYRIWTPHADDGEAFRLLVALREDLALDAAAMLGCGDFAAWEADPNAATRHAIVRAAAETWHRK